MKIEVEQHDKLKGTMAALQKDRLPWWTIWREIADYYIPKRYMWLLSDLERQRYLTKNPHIIDATGTLAGRTLAAGMMNGVTSPTRPWFKLRIAGKRDDIRHASRVWLDEVERRLLLIMAESNFYNAMAISYIDLVFFGTSSMLIYEDLKSVIRCYNCALGEYYLAQDFRQQVNTFARELTLKVHQVIDQFGLENCSDRIKTAWEQKGARLQEDVTISHLIQPSAVGGPKVKNSQHEYREVYWETAGEVGTVLAVNGYFEMPGLWPRWELTGNDAYGTSPGMDALGDVIQLQHESKRKAQSLDYLVRPPMLLDVQLQHRPTALLPGGQTFVAGLNNNGGGKPAYQINPPIGELTLDIRDVQQRIREAFHNDLFRMISQLDTVRSATEIDARREEKLVLLGPVLDRFENEALDPAINRIYNIALRAGLLPEPPREILEEQIEIQYVSILSAAQSAVGTIPTERFLALVGNISAIYPGAVNIPNWDELIRDYGRDIGVKTKNIRSKEETDALAEQQRQAEAAEKGVALAEPAAQAAKLLSETEVGGGASALTRILGS